MLVRCMAAQAQLSLTCRRYARCYVKLAHAEVAVHPCTQEAAESVQDVTRGLHVLRRQLVDAPHAVKLTLQASEGTSGHLTAKLRYDGFNDLLRSTIDVRSLTTRSAPIHVVHACWAPCTRCD